MHPGPTLVVATATSLTSWRPDTDGRAGPQTLLMKSLNSPGCMLSMPACTEGPPCLATKRASAITKPRVNLGVRLAARRWNRSWKICRPPDFWETQNGSLALRRPKC